MQERMSDRMNAYAEEVSHRMFRSQFSNGLLWSTFIEERVVSVEEVCSTGRSLDCDSEGSGYRWVPVRLVCLRSRSVRRQ